MKRFKNWVLGAVLLISASHCNSDKNFNPPSSLFEFPWFRPSGPLMCGKNEAQIEFQKSGPENATHFAILLSGSPATQYFTEQFPDDSPSNPYLLLKNNLIQKGYRVLEARYKNPPQECGHAGKVEGFYSACCAQGLDQVVQHNQNLYDRMVYELGYQPNNPSQRLVALGWSLGAIQLENMALLGGKQFNKLALTGILMGNSTQGCLSGQKENSDGMSWQVFMSLADAVTRSTQGCSQASGAALEYGEYFNAENFPNLHSGHLGLFEGEATHPSEHVSHIANPKQAEYLYKARNGNTLLKTYPNCGHELFYCTGGGVEADILDFLVSD